MHSDKLGIGKYESIDCTEVNLDYEPDPTLTPEENLERMDAAFYRSLARFDACQNASQSIASSSGGGSAGGASGGSGSSGSGELSGAALAGVKSSEDLSMSQESQISSEMSGTEPVEQASADGGISHRDAATTLVSADDNQTVLLNGKIPEDIPAADNDSILEAQIRQAAMTESDPEVKARLWDEYRRYKGLPPSNKGSGQDK